MIGPDPFISIAVQIIGPDPVLPRVILHCQVISPDLLFIVRSLVPT